jgi:peptidoglycan/LPS O-acetylase OafA/YrhL
MATLIVEQRTTAAPRREPSPLAAPGRLGAINGLRGLAIVAVLIFHLAYPAFWPGTTWRHVGGLPLLPFAPITEGWLGVNLFFLLSGFVLYLPYATGRRDIGGWGDAVGFWKHRCRRLMPLFWLNCVVGYLFVVKADPASGGFWKQLVVLLTGAFPFVRGLFTPPHNAVLWSLGVEVHYSVVFPFVLWVVRRWGLYPVTLATLAVRHAGVYHPSYVHGWAIGWVKDSLPGRLDDFLVGMVACDLWLRRREAMAAWSGPLLVVSFLTLALTCYVWEYQFLYRLPVGVVPWVNNLAQVAFLAMILGALGAEGWVRRFFEAWPLQVLGMMCYSLYVWHIMVQHRVWEGSPTADPVRLLAYAALLALISALTYRYVEFGSERDWRKLFRPAEG